MTDNPLGDYKPKQVVKAKKRMAKIPFRKETVVPLEESEQMAFIQYLQYKKIDYFAVPNSNALSSLNKLMAVKVMAKMKKVGLVSGVSDLVVMLNHKILFIEMKRIKGGTVSNNQKKFLKMVDKYSYAEGFVAYGCKGAIEIVERELENE